MLYGFSKVPKVWTRRYIYIPSDIINTITYLLRPHAKEHSSLLPHLAFLHYLNPQEDLHNRLLECDSWTRNISIKVGQASETIGRVTYNRVPLPPPLTRSPSHPPPPTPSPTHLASCLPCNKPNPSTVNVAPLRVLPNVFVKDTWAVCSSFIRTMLPPSICGVVYSLSDLFCIIYTEHDIIYDVFHYLHIKANVT